MNENHKELVSLWVSIAIVLMALFIVHRFIPSLIWASIVVIATYPLYKNFKKLFGRNKNLSAFIFTTIISLMILLPLSGLVTLLVKESQALVNYLQMVNREGGQAPGFLSDLPYIGSHLIKLWDEKVGQPGFIKDLTTNLHGALTPATYYIKQVGVGLAHRGFQFAFTLMCLFFFYRDGDALVSQINHVGAYCLGKRWYRYAERLPKALRGTVNGTIVVGLGVGILMGICYLFVEFPAPTLTGFITAIASMIPFLVPFVFMTVALILFSQGAAIGAIIVLIWGTIVMFVADHFIKPVMIGGAIELPFLAVLFGILGGVENLGILGLFVGPMIMVLFMTLWQEPQKLDEDKIKN